MKVWPANAPQTAKALVKDFREEILPFTRAERYIAAICMGTPFFLILADQWQRRSIWILAPLLALVPVMPALTAYIAIKFRTGKKESHQTHAFVTAVVMLVLLLVQAYVFNGLAQFTVRESISHYVEMDPAHIFGLLLTMGSMLFVTNALVYMNRDGRFTFGRHGYNIGLGVALLFVVVLPVTGKPLVHALHLTAAGIFFGGSAVCIAVFREERHAKSSLLIAGLTLLGLGLYFLNLKLESPFLAWLTLFWAETLGLWVIGIHYVLESLGELT